MATDEFDIPETGGAEGGGGGGPRRLTWLLVGILVGIAGTILVPRYLGPHLPLVQGPGLQVEGTVLEKQREEDRLLLTLDSERGAMLVTFRERVPELHLLISRGDRVTVGVDEYRPFAQDPRLVGVKKGDWERAGLSGSAADTARGDTGRADAGAPAGGGADSLPPSDTGGAAAPDTVPAGAGDTTGG